MPIEIWDAATPFPTDTDYLYFRAGDESLVKAALESAIANAMANAITKDAVKYSFKIPLTVKVTPNGEKHLGLIHAYIVESNVKEIGSGIKDLGVVRKTYINEFGAIESFKKTDFNILGSIGKPAFDIDDYRSRNILQLSADIVLGLREHSSERVVLAAHSLWHLIEEIDASQQSSTHIALRDVARYLSELAQECLAVLEHGSPFVHDRPVVNHKSWWWQAPSLVRVVHSMKLRIPKLFGSIPSKGLSTIDSWTAEILGRLGRLSTGSAKPPSVDALLEASAYCAALAERNYLRGNGALAVIFLHRSADLSLMSVCARKKCIDWTAYGGKYTPGTYSGNDPRITLKQSVEIIDAMNLLNVNAKRTAAFLELNEWRNLLIQAHYMTAIDDLIVRGIFRQIMNYLEEIGGGDWKGARDCYLRGIRLSLADFLDIDGSLTRTFEIVQLA